MADTTTTTKTKELNAEEVMTAVNGLAESAKRAADAAERTAASSKESGQKTATAAQEAAKSAQEAASAAKAHMASNVEDLLDDLAKAPPEARKRVGEKLHQAANERLNFLERGVVWVEEKTGNWLPATGRAFVYGSMVYTAARGAKKVYNTVTKAKKGDVAGAVKVATAK